MMGSRLLVWVVMLLACALILATCGGGSGDSAVPGSREDAVARCQEEAAKVEDPSGRRTAQAVCGAAQSGNPGEVRDAARRQCLEIAKNLPDAATRQRAESLCASSVR